MDSIVSKAESLADRSARGYDKKQRAAILRELEEILRSRFFKNAARGKQFLKYVVEKKLEDDSESLKERTIGVAVFSRPADYATGDDPVVRVQAGEVRRRLAQFYQEFPDRSNVQIELPLGSYSPEFRWPSPITPEETILEASTQGTPELAAHSQPLPVHVRVGKSRRSLIVGVFCLFLAAAAGILFSFSHREIHNKAIIDQFWAPIFATPQPVIVCLAKAVSYRPNPEVYQRYSQTHSGAFSSELERSNNPLPLRADEKLVWGDMQLYPDFGLAAGDVKAAVKISVFLGGIRKPTQVRINNDYSYEDLRSSPAVTIGAFNNKWTLGLMSKLHFVFVEENGSSLIKEQIPNGRVWRGPQGRNPGSPENYAVVSRLLDSKSGQFTITVAGITALGTEAAGEFITSPQLLAQGLRNAPKDWQTKNIQFVLGATTTDSRPDAPRVIATYFW